MKRIQAQEEGFRSLAERVLAWLSCTFRPLTVVELQHALAVEEGDTSRAEDNYVDAETIVSVCGGLAVIEHESRQIHLVHYTAQE